METPALKRQECKHVLEPVAQAGVASPGLEIPQAASEVKCLSKVFFRSQCRLRLALCFGNKVLFSARNVRFHCRVVFFSLFQNRFVQKV